MPGEPGEVRRVIGEEGKHNRVKLCLCVVEVEICTPEHQASDEGKHCSRLIDKVTSFVGKQERESSEL